MGSEGHRTLDELYEGAPPPDVVLPLSLVAAMEPALKAIAGLRAQVAELRVLVADLTEAVWALDLRESQQD